MKINLNTRNQYIFFGDMILSIISVVAAYILRLGFIELFNNNYLFLQWFLLCTLTIKPITYYLLGLYRKTWIYASIRELKLVFAAVTISSVFITVIMLILSANNVFVSFPRSVLVFDWILSILFVGGLRFSLRINFEGSKNLKNQGQIVRAIHGLVDNILIPGTDKFMIIIVSLYGIAYLLFGGVISVHDGFGWDGQVYRNIAKSFGFSLTLFKKLNAYSIQRIIPSGLVHFGLKLFQLPMTDEFILLGFKILNILLMLVSVYTFIKIANELKFSIAGKWLCFFGLFMNYAVSKQFFYYPVLTDQMAFTLGLLLLYFFLKNHTIGLLITTIIGSFTWPLLIYYGLLLYIFPRRDSVRFPIRRKLSFFISILTVLILLFGYIWVYFIRDIKMPDGSIQINDSYVYISIFCSIIYIFIGLNNLFCEVGIPNIRNLNKVTSIVRVFTGLLILVLVKVLINFLSADSTTSLSTIAFIERVVIASIVRPFNFYIAHVVYFGPIILLTTFLWKPFNRIVSRYGLGLSLLVAINFILSLFSESRTLIPAFSFFVIFTVAEVEENKWPFWFYWIFGIASFIFSKIWLPLGNIPLSGGYFKFPYQWYFMNYGPWMSDLMYVIQGIIVLISGIIFFSIIKEIYYLQNK